MNGQFKKGEITNKAGRPKGSLNKSTAQIREVLSMVAVNNLGKVQYMLDKCNNPDKFLTQYFALMKFVLPTLSKAEIDTNVSGELKVNVRYIEEPIVITPHIEE